MSQDALPERALRFVAKFIVSVEQLEILLLLSDSPDKYWRVEEVFQRIQSSTASVTERLALLLQQGFLETDSQDPASFRYRPASPELADEVDALRPLYLERRVKVIEAIYAVPDQIRSFAEAFKFKNQK